MKRGSHSIVASDTKKVFLIMAVMVFLCWLPVHAQVKGTAAVTLQLDGTKKFQQIDGIGVNANTRSWNGEELKPALELLLDSANATIWRVIVETVEKWEEQNDNDDPFVFNWDYYNKLYETPKFQKAWDMIAYLNKRGITDKLIINFMGVVPQWMGGEVVKPEFEDEYIEMLVSFFHYARNVKHLKIGLIAPMNEPDIRKEGPTVGAEQYARLLKKLVLRMEAVGLGDIPYNIPDVAGMKNGLKSYIPELMKEPVIMKKVKHMALHSYAGYYAPVDSTLRKSPYPKSTYWVTEWNAWCKGCDDGILGEYNYNFASKSVGFLLELLKNNARAALAWEAYDSYYEHHAPSLFSYWGMLGYEPESRTYFPRKNFFAIQQVSKYVLPDSYRIDVSEAGEDVVVLAFYHQPSKRVTIVGINKKKSSVTLKGNVKGLGDLKAMEIIYTDTDKNLQKGQKVKVSGRTFEGAIPADCIFTLTGFTK